MTATRRTTVDAPARRSPVDAPARHIGPAAVLRAYERKEAGRYGFTLVEGDRNATLVQDTASGDVYFSDAVIDGSMIIVDAADGRLSIASLPLV